MTINWKGELIVFRYFEPALVEERLQFESSLTSGLGGQIAIWGAGRFQVGKEIAAYRVTVEADNCENCNVIIYLDKKLLP